MPKDVQKCKCTKLPYSLMSSCTRAGSYSHCNQNIEGKYQPTKLPQRESRVQSKHLTRSTPDMASATQTTPRRRAVRGFILHYHFRSEAYTYVFPSSAPNASRERSDANGRKISMSASAVNAVNWSVQCLVIHKRHCGTPSGRSANCTTEHVSTDR